MINQAQINIKAVDDFTSLVLPASLKTMRSKRLCQTFKCLELSRASVSSMPHYPVRIPGLRDFSSGDTVPTSINPVSPLITGLHFTLPTRVNFTIFSKY